MKESWWRKVSGGGLVEEGKWRRSSGGELVDKAEDS